MFIYNKMLLKIINIVYHTLINKLNHKLYNIIQFL
jgi:hypothetical protein